MASLVISGSGLYAPEEVISNQELVTSFNTYVEQFNAQHAEAIATGEVAALQPSSDAFIVKASGIKRRHVIDKTGTLAVDVMRPQVSERADTELCLQAEMAVKACQEAMQAAGKTAADIDAIILGCSAMQRPYPAIAVEVQSALGIDGFGFDLNVACSSATFAIQTAADAVANDHARAALVVNPEICTGHLNFRDRNSHFIFGDAATAVVVEKAEDCAADKGFDIVSTTLKTKFSTNIRNNFGFLNRAYSTTVNEFDDKLFYQDGRKVFKDVVPLVVKHINEHLQKLEINPQQVKRFWLHQANSNMNRLIATKLLGREPTESESPTILDEYANTSSAGSIIAFHEYHQDLAQGDVGVLCSFGAGYSIGSVVLKKR